MADFGQDRVCAGKNGRGDEQQEKRGAGAVHHSLVSGQEFQRPMVHPKPCPVEANEGHGGSRERGGVRRRRVPAGFVCLEGMDKAAW